MHTNPYAPPNPGEASMALAGRSFAPRWGTPGALASLTVTTPINGSVTGSSGSTSGNAATATALQTARAINGVNFDGTAAITVTAAAGTLSGATLAAGVTASSLTSVGVLTALAVAGAVTQVTDLTTTGNTTLGDASSDTLNVGNGGIVKDSSGNTGIGATAAAKFMVNGGTTISTLTDWNTKANTVFQLANPAVRLGVGYTASDNPHIQGFDTSNSAKNLILNSLGGTVLIGTATDPGTCALGVSGNIAVTTAGNGIRIKEGSNAKQGKSTMVAGVVTVSTTAVTSSSRIFYGINDAGSGALTNIGSIYVNNIIAGTSFDIRSTNVLDTSSVVWLINEPT